MLSTFCAVIIENRRPLLTKGKPYILLVTFSHYFASTGGDRVSLVDGPRNEWMG